MQYNLSQSMEINGQKPMTNYQTFIRVQFQLLFLCSILIIIYTSYFNFEAIEKRDNKHKQLKNFE